MIDIGPNLAKAIEAVAFVVALLGFFYLLTRD